MQAALPDGSPVVGFVRPAKICGKAPPTEPVKAIRDPRMAYSRYMACPPRQVVVQLTRPIPPYIFCQRE